MCVAIAYMERERKPGNCTWESENGLVFLQCFFFPEWSIEKWLKIEKEEERERGRQKGKNERALHAV